MRETKLSVLEMVFFENWKHLCWPKHNWKNEKNKNKKKGTWKTKQNRKTQKTGIIDEKKPFKYFFRETNAKKQGKKKQKKTRKENNKQESKETKKKTR